VDKLWGPATSGGWRPSSAPRSYWPCMLLLMIFPEYTFR